MAAEVAGAVWVSKSAAIIVHEGQAEAVEEHQDVPFMKYI